MAGRDEGTGALIEPRNNRARRALAVTIIPHLQSFTQWWVTLTKPRTQKFGHSRRFLVLIFAIFAAMVLLTLAKPVLDKIVPAESSGWEAYFIRFAISTLLGLLLSYVFTRIADVVHGDYDLVDLQSNYMVRAVERKAAKRFEDRHLPSSNQPLQSPDGYGKLLQ
jgi:hypothetical protein